MSLVAASTPLRGGERIGPPVIGDDYFWIAHSDATGAPRAHRKAVGLGCAAAMLADLTITEHVRAFDNRLLILDAAVPPDDAQNHLLMELLVREKGRRHTLRTLLAFLSVKAVEDIASRLQRANHLSIHEITRLGRKVGSRYLPTDINRAAAPWALLSTRLRREEPLTEVGLVLAGLISATGLDKFVLDGAPASAYEALHKQLSNLTDPMRELLFHTRAAVGDAVLSHRT